MKKIAFGISLLTVGMFWFSVQPEASTPPRYTYKKLFTLWTTTPHAINVAGQIAGDFTTASGAGHAFLYSLGTLHDLDTLPPPNDYSSAAFGINVGGQVVGSSTNYGLPHAFIYNGGMQNLGALFPLASEATCINTGGQVAGWFATTVGAYHAFLYRDGGVYDLGIITGGVDSYAHGINDAGHVVGDCSYSGTGFQHAFYYNGSMQDLGTLQAPYNATSKALGINANDKVVGWSKNSAKVPHAFLYSGSMHDLGTLGGSDSQAFGINNIGQVVGQAGVAAGGDHAFLYRGGIMYDLNNLLAQTLPAGEVLVTAIGINDRGQILANSSVSGYLLTPVRSLAAIDLLLQ